MTDDSPFDALVVRCASAEEAQALPAGVGSELAYLPGDVDRGSTPAEELPEAEIGRLALAVADGAASWAPMLVVDCADWSVACTLTSGQLHRLANALGGRGTRSGIRPVATTGEHVHLTGSPERLVVQVGEHAATFRPVRAVRWPGRCRPTRPRPVASSSASARR